MSLTHLLTPASDLRHVRVACGTATPDRATWLLAMVTCARCKAPRAPVSLDRGPVPARTVTTEQALQEEIRQLARAAGYLTYHTLQSKGSEPGFPDLVLAKPHHPLWFIETKREQGRVTPAQQQWMEVLQTITKVEAQIVRPQDLQELMALFSSI